MNNQGLKEFVGGQIKVVTKNSKDQHASHHAQIKVIHLEGNTLFLEYDWSVFAEGSDRASLHWAEEDRKEDQFDLFEFDEPVMVNNRLVLKKKGQTIYLYKPDDEALLSKDIAQAKSA